MYIKVVEWAVVDRAYESRTVGKESRGPKGGEARLKKSTLHVAPAGLRIL